MRRSCKCASCEDPRATPVTRSTTGQGLNGRSAPPIPAGGYRLSSDAIPVFREYVERRRGQPNFANARSIRNAIERTRLRHAARLVGAGGTVDRDALELIEPADLLGSTVFDDAAVAEP